MKSIDNQYSVRYIVLMDGKEAELKGEKKMKYEIKSIKHSESFVGTQEDAIKKAMSIMEEHQPAFGVQVEDESGDTVFDTEESDPTF